MKTLKRLSQFRPQKANANKGNPRGLTQLDKSLRRDGYSAPMVAAADGEIFAGSKRLERSADVFGVDVEPIVVHSDGKRPVIHVRDDIPTADDPRAVRLGVADNAIAHLDYEPDGELLALLAAEDAAIEEMVKADEASMKAVLEFAPQEIQDAEPQIDRAAELNKKWKVKRGDLWRIGEHRLLCGDSTVREDVERVMGGEKAELSFNDPPYRMNAEGGINQMVGQAARRLGETIKDLVDFCPDAFLGILPFVFSKNKINVYIFCNKDLVPDYLNWALSSGYNFNILFWKKPSSIPLGDSHRPDVEYLILIRKNATWNNGLNVNYSKCLEYGREDGDHPTIKPLELVQNELQISSSKGGLVVDLFCGSGTTLIACQNLHRKCRAIEISPAYCAVILQRMTDAFPGIEIERVTA